MACMPPRTPTSPTAAAAPSSGVPARRRRKMTSILSFDGGGSRGVMEVVVLDDIFRLATIIIQKPNAMPSVERLLNSTAATDKSWISKLMKDEVDEPIHPTQAFDMITGTSTGGIISMALLAGKEGSDGSRQRMTVDEVKQVYLDETKFLFSKTAWPWYNFFPRIPFLFGTTAAIPYSTVNLEHVLRKYFGSALLKDVDDHCIGGCVAKSVCVENEELIFFNTVSVEHRNVPIYQALMATGDAPIYFEGPVQIGENFYVDGGLGGNCPLKQAIPTAFETLGFDVDLFVVALAPPKPKPQVVPAGILDQVLYWLGYFPSQVTSGGLIYRELKAEFSMTHPSRFFRLAPKGDKLCQFGMDETDVSAMIQETENWVAGDGLIEVLPVVFAVVAEILCRDRAAAERDEDHRKKSPLESRQATYDWILENCRGLMDVFQKDNDEVDSGVVEHLNSTTNQLEMQEYLLMSVERALSSFENDPNVTPDCAAELDLLKQLGKTSALRGKHSKACGYYDRVLLQYANIDSPTGDDHLRKVEVHLLYSDAMFNLGDYGCLQEGGDGRRGAQWHSEMAIKILDIIAGDAADIGDPDYQRFLRKSAEIQMGKIFMNLGYYNRAWEYLELYFDKPSGNDNNNARSSVAPLRFSNSSVVSRNRMGMIEIGTDMSDVMLNVGLCMMRRGKRAEAKEAFEAVCNHAETDFHLCPWMTATCHGFIDLLNGKPFESYEKFVQSLDDIKNMTGTSASPQRAIADNFSFMGLAAYEAGMKKESLRYWRRAEQTMLLADNDHMHPLLGAANSNMGAVMTEFGSFNEARRHFREAKRQFSHLHRRCLEDKSATEEIIEIANNEACLAFAQGDILSAVDILRDSTIWEVSLTERVEDLKAKLKENLSKAEIALANQEAGIKISENRLEFFIFI